MNVPVVVKCSGCGRPVADDTNEGANRVPCPHCGSAARVIDTNTAETLTLLDGVGVKHKRPSVRRRKPIFQSFTGYEQGRDPSRPRLVYKEDVIDYENDRRRELVVDQRTGEVIRDIDHTLSEHRGRGSAKPGRRRG
jgi:DNA-directed RNA polymerase subunit RPC12/RpoP